jgi:hypothetical protein
MDLSKYNPNSQFLLYKTDKGDIKVDVLLQNETIWMPQSKIAELFEVQRPAITKHLNNIFESGELDEKVVSSILELTTQHGAIANKTQAKPTKFYNLDAIIAVGYRINSKRATQFRIWATAVLKEFFATVQNKLHWAITKQTAAEIIVARANHEKEKMGLTNWKNSPDGKIRKSDVSIAKNYLTADELKPLNRIVSMYLDYAEDQAEQGNVMKMIDWSEKLNAFLQFNQKDILQNSGKVTAAIAKEFAENEYEKYKPIQDKMFESDFDKEIKKLLK